MTTILLAALLSLTAQNKEEDYYPIVRLPIPPGVVLEGGGMELMPDGKLAISSRRGDIYMVENAFLNPPDPDKVKFTLYAQGLHEVLGLSYYKGWLYATQRCEITKIKDKDGDGRADMFRTVCDDWSITGDYHEYAFGSKFDSEGNMWVVLCLTGSFNSNAPYRGCTQGGWLVLLVVAERNLDLGSIDASQDSVDEYLHSVGDALPIYSETGIAPPLYSAASALGALLRELALPPGAIHSLQEVETLMPVAIGSGVKVSALVEKPRRRAGLEFITVVCSVESGGALALRSKSTVLVPSGDTPEAAPKEPQNAEPIESGLAIISKEIDQGQLNAYAKASGDDNPLHLDPEFAAGTQFGGIIAHGMLTLAFVSEMMAAAHGRDWLESGGLRIRFKGAAYLGDRVEAWGNVAKEQGASRTYSVGVRNSANGQELITGAAGLTIK